MHQIILHFTGGGFLRGNPSGSASDTILNKYWVVKVSPGGSSGALGLGTIGIHGVLTTFKGIKFFFFLFFNSI